MNMVTVEIDKDRMVEYMITRLKMSPEMVDEVMKYIETLEKEKK